MFKAQVDFFCWCLLLRFICALNTGVIMCHDVSMGFKTKQRNISQLILVVFLSLAVSFSPFSLSLSVAFLYPSSLSVCLIFTLSVLTTSGWGYPVRPHTHTLANTETYITLTYSLICMLTHCCCTKYTHTLNTEGNCRMNTEDFL